jgi:hypothetical protein
MSVSSGALINTTGSNCVVVSERMLELEYFSMMTRRKAKSDLAHKSDSKAAMRMWS